MRNLYNSVVLINHLMPCLPVMKEALKELFLYLCVVSVICFLLVQIVMLGTFGYF